MYNRAKSSEALTIECPIALAIINGRRLTQKMVGINTHGEEEPGTTNSMRGHWKSTDGLEAEIEAEK